MRIIESCAECLYDKQQHLTDNEEYLKEIKIFDIALSRAGCSPENAVMIGDRLDNDIAPAKRLGMKTVRVKQGYAKYWTVKSQDEQADFEVDDLSEIPGLI